MKHVLYKLFIFSVFFQSVTFASKINLDEVDPVEKQRLIGSFVVPSGVHHSLYQALHDVTSILIDAHIPYMGCYGTALGAVREGGIIAHDDDVDIAIDQRDSSRLKKLTPMFEALGYKLEYDQKLSRYIAESSALISIPIDGKEPLSYHPFIDIFVFQEQGNGVFELAEPWAREHSALARGSFSKEEFSNRKLSDFGPLTLPIPKQVIPYLHRKYNKKCLEEVVFIGNHTQTLDNQTYTWTLAETDSALKSTDIYLENPFKEFKKTQEYHKLSEQFYWNTFYEGRPDLKKASSFAEYVAHKHISHWHKKNMAEFGCGNARDTFFFAEKGHTITGYDFSKDAIMLNTQAAQALSKKRPQFQLLDVTNENDLRKIAPVDYIYTRFFLHSLSDANREPFMAYLGYQKKGTHLFFEFRTDKDPLLLTSEKREGYADNEGDADGHYRCFINFAQFKIKLKNLNYKIIEETEANNLSVFEKNGYIDNPVLARIIAKKR